MAKNNNNNNNSYFSQHVQKYGEDFLAFKTAKDLEFDALKVFRELARNKVDILKYGRYFLDPQFMESCIKICTTKLQYHAISYNGIQYMITSMQNNICDPNVYDIADQHKRSASAYRIIYDHLLLVAQSGNYNHLITMSSQLSKFKYDL